MTTYQISIKNCNSIESTEISIVKGALNIKYGPNGLGKSSIVKAIVASIANDGTLQNLKPFKHRSLPGQHEPTVSGLGDITSILVFDDAYVSQFAFQRDEVVKNSFDIFIKTESFLTAMRQFEVLFSGIKSTFDGNEALNAAISDLKELRDAFGVTKTGALSKSSKGYKAYGAGNKIENIPQKLLPFEAFIRCDQPSTWISWQGKGNAYLDLSDNCPYCASDLKEPEKKDTARQVAKEYDSKAVEHLSALQVVISRLGKYFVQSCRDKLEATTKAKIGLSLEETNFLSALRGDVETLLTKLEGLRAISFFALRDVDKIEDEIVKLKIELGFLEQLNSDDTKAVVEPINAKLQELMEKIGELKGGINKHKVQIAKSIAANENDINGFLKSAGYKYSVAIKSEVDSYKMKLVHQDFDAHLETAAQHLSYGEKNAFALVLFMHQVLSQNPSLAILDDPVSSFDKTKKFAILNELFQGKTSLRNSTVLMVTHDIEPAIDIVLSLSRVFQQAKPSAYFLTSKRGVITETKINKSDILTFAQICSSNVQSLADEVIKCIYLRRHYEINNDKGFAYEYLANLLHARAVPVLKTDAGDIPMTAEHIASAVAQINSSMPNFNYQAILSIINNKSEMQARFKTAVAGYDKLQLFRVYRQAHFPDEKGSDAILQKFVNESFHIENEYLMQLNPHKYENTPEYVIDECDRIVNLP